jgi:hypothetical protein
VAPCRERLDLLKSLAARPVLCLPGSPRTSGGGLPWLMSVRNVGSHSLFPNSTFSRRELARQLTLNILTTRNQQQRGRDVQYCTKCGNVIEEGEEYCSRCGQPAKKKQSSTKGEMGRPSTAKPSSIGKTAEELSKKNDILRIRWVVMVVIALAAVVFVALPWLTLIVENSPSSIENGLTLDYSAIAFATGFESYYGYTFRIEPSLIYWIIILPAAVSLIISVIGIVGPKYTTGLAVYTLVLDAVLGIGIVSVYVFDLQYKLGTLYYSSYTFFGTLGWGFFGEIGMLMVAPIVSIWLIFLARLKN